MLDNLDIQYYNTDKKQYMCFKHAIKYALSGDEIISEIDEFGGDQDMRSLTCKECKKEEGNEWECIL